MSEINVTPLIDLAFALLIIFMITAPLLQQTIDIAVPIEATRPQKAAEREPLLLGIDARGQFYWTNEAISDREMAERLRLLGAEGEPPVVQVRADASLAYQRVIDLLDLIKGAGLKQLSLETRSR